MRFTSKLSLLTLCSVALHNLMVINHEGIRRRVPILHSSAGLRMGRRNFRCYHEGGCSYNEKESCSPEHEQGLKTDSKADHALHCPFFFFEHCIN